MPNYTANRNLYKVDPAADGALNFNIVKILNENWDKIDAILTSDLAKYKAGSGTFTTRGTTHTVTDSFCTAGSHVFLNITGSVVPQGVWSGDSFDGGFTITSDTAETQDITFTYTIVKAVG